MFAVMSSSVLSLSSLSSVSSLSSSTSLPLLFCVSLLCVLCLYLLFSLFRLSLTLVSDSALDARLSTIPKPKIRYPFSHLVDLVSREPWEVLRDWLTLYGPIIRFHFGSMTYIVVSDPDMIARVFNNRTIYIKDKASLHHFSCLLGNGLVTSEGDEWSQQRSCLAPVLRNDILDDTVSVSLHAADRLALTLRSRVLSASATNATNVIEEMGEHFRHITLQVIGETVLSMSASDSDSVFPDLYLPIADESNRRVYFPIRAYLPLPASFTHASSVRALNSFVQDIIVKRARGLQAVFEAKPTMTTADIQAMTEVALKDETSTSSSSSGSNSNSNSSSGNSNSNSNSSSGASGSRRLDILDRMILSQFTTSKAKSGKLSDADVNQLRDQIKTFLFAGHETTSMMLTWALYELMLHPECMSIVRSEAEALWGTLSFDSSSSSASPSIRSNKLSIDHESIKSGLGYTAAVLKETLRKWSVVPLVTRCAVQDDIIAPGITVPKDASIAVNIKAVHMREDLWPNPSAFLPSRFYDVSSGTVPKLVHPFAFLPFIAGPRNCLGQHFALLEAKILLSRLVLLFNFAPASQDQGRNHKLNIPVMPVKRMQTLLTLRQ